MNVKFLTNAIMPKAKDFGKFYIRHESIFLTAGIIGSSVATTAVTMMNARFILNTIDDAKQMVAEAKDKDEKNKIIGATIKEIAPKLLPIIIFQSLTIFCTLKSKKESDKKINELTDALSMANNAIASYKVFEKEAKEKLGDGKFEEVKKEVADDIVKAHTETPENHEPAANNSYLYWDNYCNRYFYSTVSPSEMRARVHNLSIKFTKGEINNYDDAGRCKVTYNDIYELFGDKSLIVHPAGDAWGWYDMSDKYRGVDEDVISVYISPTEDPNDPDHTVWFFDLEGGPFFRTK